MPRCWKRWEHYSFEVIEGELWTPTPPPSPWSRKPINSRVWVGSNALHKQVWKNRFLKNVGVIAYWRRNCQRIDELAWLYCESITNTISPFQGNPDLYYNITTSVTITQYYELVKIESLDNAILELWLAKPSWCTSHYTMLSKYGNCTRLPKIKNKLKIGCSYK